MTVDLEGVRTTLLKLLSTPSYAGEETAVAAMVCDWLTLLGCEVTRDRAGTTFGGACGNVIARLPGTVDAPAILFNAHLDTVGRTEGLEPVVDNGLVRTNGETVLGSDDKAGVTAILEGVALAVAERVPRPPLEIVFTVAEETGLHGARALDLSQFDAELGFVFDGGTPLGALTVSAPTHALQAIRVIGKAAHAGVEPELGVNAIRCAAVAIAKADQGRLDHETTANIGVISGGSATNIVSEVCELKAEVRSRDEAKLERQVAHFRRVFEEATEASGCTLEFSSRTAYQGFRIDQGEPVAQLAAQAVQAAGLAVEFVEGGGGSDANVFNAAGLRCILMPCGQRDPHTSAESVAIEDVATAATVVAQLIRLAVEAG